MMAENGDKQLAGNAEGDRTTSSLQFSSVQTGRKDDTIFHTATDLTLTKYYLDDKTANYVIHADTVHLADNLELKGKNITINARVISSDGEVIINTSGNKSSQHFNPDESAESGDNGKMKGSSGTDGKPGSSGGVGQTAGNITLAAEKFELGGRLRLIANGGQGGRGQNGGDGGTGANGPDGNDGRINRFSSNDDPTDGGSAGNGGNGGSAGKSGDGGNGGDIFVGFVVSAKEQLITMESRPGQAGEQASPGRGKDGGKGGTGGREIIVKYITGYMTTMKDEKLGDKRRPSGRDGTKGNDGSWAGPAADGKPGRCGPNGDGSPTAIDYKRLYGGFEAGAALASFDSRLAGSLEQKTLTLNKAGNAYLASSEDKIEEAAELLVWLLKTIPDAGWFDEIREITGDENDGKFKAFADFRDRILPVSLQWLALRNKVSILIAQLSQGLDYFGHPWNWIPLMPLERYVSMGSALIDSAQQAESLYMNYLEFKDKKDSQVGVIRKAMESSEQKIAEMEKRKEELVGQRRQLKATADAMLKDIEKKETYLQQKSTEFVDALKKALEMESMKAALDLVVTGVALVTNVAPVVGALKAGGALASAVSNLVSEGKTIVIDEEGKDKKTIGKEKKAQEKELSKSLDSVKKTASAGYALWKQGGGLIDLAKQQSQAQGQFGYSSTLMTMSREDFEEMIQPVFNKVPAKAAEYRKAFYDFMNVVEDYQRKLQAYKAFYLEDEKLTAEITGLRSEKDRISQTLGDQSSPSLPLFHTYILGLYNRAKLDLIDFLYQEYQAFRYLTLKNERFPKIEDSHVAELSRIHANIILKLTKVLNEAEGPVQPYKNVKFIFSEESFPEQFNSLRESGEAVFSLSLDNKLIRDKIGGKAHMTVSSCHIHLPGARDTEGDVYVKYMHSGSSTFLDPYAERHDFIHLRSEGFYEYEVKFEGGAASQGSKGEKFESKFGGAIGDGHNRIMPGLLSVWTIKVPRVDPANIPLNEGVDLSKVKRIEMTIEGKAEAYAEKAPSNRLRVGAIAKVDIHASDNELFFGSGREETEDPKDLLVIEL
jgi:hypothetical protein